MGVPWQAERSLDAAWAAQTLARVPEVAGWSVKPLGEGFDNAAFRVRNPQLNPALESPTPGSAGYVFRFPRRAFAVPFLEAEIRWLPALAAGLPVPISAPTISGVDADGWPFAGYPALAGETACRAGLRPAERADLAPALGRCLRALHQRPVPADLHGDTLRRADPHHRIAQGRERIPLLDRWDTATAQSASAALEQTFAELQGPATRTCVVHGDLYPRHLLVAAGQLSGVIDWGDLHHGDPALDLAIAPALLPPAAWPTFCAAYGGVDTATWRRARFRTAWHTLATLWYGAEIGDAALLEAGRIALDHLRTTGPDLPR